MLKILRSLNHAAAWRGFQKAWGHGVYCPSLDRRLYLTLHRLGLMGTLERMVIEKFVEPDARVIDIGGNVGLYAMHMGELAGAGGSVAVFEPVAELFDALNKSIKKAGAANIRTFPYALGAQNGEVCIVPNAFNSGDNQVKNQTSPADGGSVPLKRLDSVDLGYAPSFVKIDVQGWEVEVLKGMSGFLGGADNPTLFCEVSETMLRMANASTLELGQMILSHGYAIYLPSKKNNKLFLEPYTLEMLVEKAGQISYFDILAFPKDRPPPGE